MKRSEFKALLKECIREVLKEELKKNLTEIMKSEMSSVITEVLGSAPIPSQPVHPMYVQTPYPQYPQMPIAEQQMHFNTQNMPAQPAMNAEQYRAMMAQKMGMNLPSAVGAKNVPAAFQAAASIPQNYEPVMPTKKEALPVSLRDNPWADLITPDYTPNQPIVLDA